MPGGPGRFGRGSSCPALLRVPAGAPRASPTGLSPPPARRSSRFGSRHGAPYAGPTTPGGPQPARFGLLPGRSPLLGESLLSSPPPATGMFRFAGFAPPRGGAGPSARRVAPFGHPQVNGRVRLAGAFRGLPRPSSPPGATGIRRAPCLTSRALAPRGIPARGRRAARFLCVARRGGSGPPPAARVASKNVVENAGLEPAAPGLQSRCSTH